MVPNRRDLLLRLTRDTRRMLAPWQTLDMRRLGRVLSHSMLVGAISGGVACAFFFALEWAQYLLTGLLAHFEPARPRGEPMIVPNLPDGDVNLWVLALLPAVGGLACGLVVRFAPEAGGAGGDAMINTFHNHRGIVRKRVPAVKLLASLLTIASGGSAGREGPVMHSTSGLASNLARAMRLDDQERRILLIAGAAAGVSAIFRTPLGAALYAVEVLYRDDFETDAIVPAIIASVTGYSIFTTVYGQGHLFQTEPSYAFLPLALPAYAAMAVGLSMFAVALVVARERIAAVFESERLRLPLWARPALGGLLLGLLAIFVPEALGVGYGLIQGAIEGAPWIPENGYMLLWGLAAAKILSTGLTVGSGGSGGEFGPTLVIGGLVGGGFGLWFHELAPTLVPQPGAFALVGMGAMLGGIMHVPVSSLIMVCEMTGSYDLLVPLMLGEAITFVLLRGHALHPYQVPTRIDSPAHRDEATVDILESLAVTDVYEPGQHLLEVRNDDTLDQVMATIAESDHPGLIVRDHKGSIAGMISLDAIQGSFLAEGLGSLALAADVMSRPQIIDIGGDLHDVLHSFLLSGMSVLPVVDHRDDGDVSIGIITQLDVTRAYDEAVEERLARARLAQQRG